MSMSIISFDLPDLGDSCDIVKVAFASDSAGRPGLYKYQNDAIPDGYISFVKSIPGTKGIGYPTRQHGSGMTDFTTCAGYAQPAHDILEQRSASQRLTIVCLGLVGNRSQ